MQPPRGCRSPERSESKDYTLHRSWILDKGRSDTAEELASDQPRSASSLVRSRPAVHAMRRAAKAGLLRRREFNAASSRERKEIVSRRRVRGNSQQ
jgi:hypothetical protein